MVIGLASSRMFALIEGSSNSKHLQSSIHHTSDLFSHTSVSSSHILTTVELKIRSDSDDLGIIPYAPYEKVNKLKLWNIGGLEGYLKCCEIETVG